MNGGWQTVRVGRVELDAPEEVARTSDQEIESPVATLDGAGIRLTVDGSPFADPLTRYESQAEYRHDREDIGGETADVVSFRAEDGTGVIAARLSSGLTAVAHITPEGDRDVVLRMLRSIRPIQEED
jgi:hypothetical protein